MPQTDSLLTAKVYVDNSIDEPTLVRNNRDNDFKNHHLTNINSITPKTQAVNENNVITKSYVGQLHSDNERSRQHLGMDFYGESIELVKNNQDNDFNNNKTTNTISITINRNPTSNYEVPTKNIYIDDELDRNTILRFNQTLQIYLKVSVGNDTYNLTEYDKIQLIDLTEIRSPNIGSDLLPKRKIKNLHKNNRAKVGIFLKIYNTIFSNKKIRSNQHIGNSFMYIETISNNHGNERVFVSFARTDIKQTSNITFFYNRCSILTNDLLKSIGRYRIQLLLEVRT